MVKNYLLSRDLWTSVIEDAEAGTTPEKEEERKKNNAKALHILQMSCGSETLSRIKESTTAKSAWNTLASLYRSRLGANADIEQGNPTLFSVLLSFFKLLFNFCLLSNHPTN